MSLYKRVMLRLAGDTEDVNAVQEAIVHFAHDLGVDIWIEDNGKWVEVREPWSA